jgi:L-malate glycosyltransferase
VSRAVRTLRVLSVRVATKLGTRSAHSRVDDVGVSGETSGKTLADMSAPISPKTVSYARSPYQAKGQGCERAGAKGCIVYVLGLVPEKLGGLETFCGVFAEHASLRGWQVIYCFEGPAAADTASFLSRKGAVIEQLPFQAGIVSNSAFRLYLLLRRYRPKILVYGLNGVLRSYPWVATLAGIPRVFYNDHSSRNALRGQGYRSSAMEPAKRWLGRQLTRPLTATIGVSGYVRRSAEAEGFSRGPIHVVHNGVAIPTTDEPAWQRKANAFRDRFGIKPDALVVTQVGWVVPQKGVEILLRAARGVCAAVPQAHFVFVGTGSHLAAYQRLAANWGLADKVSWTGLLQSPVDDGAYHAAQVVCQLSLWEEAFGLTIAEAMSCGVPVVASRLGGIPEIVVDGETGCLVEPGDVAAVAARLCELLTDSVKRRQMGRAGFARAREYFDVRRAAHAYCDVMGL